MEYLETRAADVYQGRFDAALSQLERVRVSLLPFGRPQERVYNAYAYLNRYGRKWLDDLVKEPLSLDGLHKLYHFF